MSFEVTVNFKGSSFVVCFSPSWSIARLKDEIAQRRNVLATEIKIIFAGQELPDSWKLGHEFWSFSEDDGPPVLDYTKQSEKDCDMNHSVIHAVQKKVGQLTMQIKCDNETGLPTLNHVELTSEDHEGLHNDTLPSSSHLENCHSYFFVFCKSCKQLTQGKLRCCCSLCKNGGFVLTQGPNSWEDVSVKGKLHGQCESNSSCSGTTAEFYFKCGEHHGNDKQAPLCMVKSNVRNIPCLTCSDVSKTLLVFPCNSQHTMCLDCFISYCVTSLDSRNFVQTETEGYTIPCPGNLEGCRSAFISEPHHFRLLGNEQYERYQRFATEQCVLDAGGVLCPGPGCGQGILPAQRTRRTVCEHGCRLVFCRDCLREYHNGSCDGPTAGGGAMASDNGTTRFQVTRQSDQVARWERESQDLIRNTTKQCPNSKCGVSIEKNAGCNHMTCSRCKFEWCWICCIQWNRNCQSNHWFRS